MTTATVFTRGDEIIGFEIKGHTGYAEHGSDIVCAAVSGISQTAVLGLTEVMNLEIDCQIEDSGLLRVNLVEGVPEGAQLILKTMIAGLRNIQQQHPDHIRITHSERR